MATPNYHNGSDGRAFVTPTGGTKVEIAIVKWDLTIKGNNKDVSNGKDGRKRIPGVQDAEGSLMLHWDSANQQTATGAGNPGIRAGAVVQLLLIQDGSSTDGFALSAILDEVHPSSEFEGTIDFDCKFSLESGSVTYPT